MLRALLFAGSGAAVLGLTVYPLSSAATTTSTAGFAPHGMIAGIRARGPRRLSGVPAASPAPSPSPQPCYTGGTNLVFIGIAGEFNEAGYLSAVAGGDSNAACGSQAFIGGGGSNDASGSYSAIGGGDANQATNIYSTVGGGLDNVASGSAAGVGSGYDAMAIGNNSFIGAGEQAMVTGNGSFIGAGGYTYTTTNGKSGVANSVTSVDSFLGSGDLNNISAVNSFIGGGGSNMINTKASYSVVAGGYLDQTELAYATVGGGDQNTAGGEFATIPGGFSNTASGTASFAAGYHADAVNAGSFVWSDYSSGSAVVKDAVANQFVVRASGGTTIYSSETLGSGVSLAAGSGTWSSLSDRNAKTEIVPLDGSSVLSKIDALPISTWRYKTERGARHAGPMAQDFYASFGLGEDDRHITSIDEDGVALAAIKALHRENAGLRSEVQRLAAAVARLEHR